MRSATTSSLVFGHAVLLDSLVAVFLVVELLVVMHVVDDVSRRLVLPFDVVFFEVDFGTHCGGCTADFYVSATTAVCGTVLSKLSICDRTVAFLSAGSLLWLRRRAAY